VAFVERAATGEEMLAAKETAGRLTRTLARLPAQQRAAFDLVKGEGKSLADAAAILGTTVTGVKLRAHRAYVALRTDLAAA
jgi:RNA polymerase sigma-70 factor (ECF subfamily)